MNKKLIVSFVAVVIMGGTFFVVPQAHAQGTNVSNSQPGFFQGLIQFIEQKFGLDKTQVQTAVTQYKQQRKANITPRPTMSAADMQAREKIRLDKLVSSGKITSAQESAIITELATLHTKYDPANMKGMTPDQRKTQMQAMQSDLKTWEQANGIDPSILMQTGGGMMGRPGGGPGMRKGGRWNGNHPSMTPTPTTAQ